MKRKIDGNVEITGTLNDHTIPGGTGTLALTSDISTTGIELDVTNSGDQLIIESNDTGYPELLLTQPELVNSNANGPKITLEKISYDSINSTRNGDELGRIDFKGHKNSNVDQVYGSIIGISAVDNNPGPGGSIEFEVSDMNENSNEKMVTIFGGTTSNQFHQGLRIDRGNLWLAPYSTYTGSIILEGSTHDLTIRPTGTETFGANLLIPREGGTVITTNSIDDYTSDLTSPVTIQLDADAVSGATLNLYHNSATPADEDILGRINFNGENSSSVNETFAYIQAQAFDVTNANEDGYVKIGGQKDGSFKVWTKTGSFTNGSGLEIVTGNLYLNDITDGNIIFEGSTDNGFETTLTVDDPTADRTITLPNKTGTVALTSDIGSSVSILNQINIANPTTSANAFFGNAVDISGDYMIVGAYQADNSGNDDSGKAYIYDVHTGHLIRTLTNPNTFSTVTDDFFGRAVGISGNYAVVGASSEDSSGSFSAGAAYIFNVTTGALIHTIQNPNAFGTPASDFFGRTIATHGKYSIFGVHEEDEAGGALSSGKAYVINNETGGLVYTFDNPNAFGGAQNDYFGFSVDISDNYAIVGAYLEDFASSDNSGRVYVFDLSTGTLVHSIANPNAYGAVTSDYFGYSVAIDGNYFMAGARNEDDAIGNASGKAYVFDLESGALLHTLDNPTPAINDQFGDSMSISGNYGIVSAHQDNTATASGGAVYIFNLSTGTLAATMLDPNVYTSTTDRFGNAVAISGDNIVVGAEREEGPGGEVDSGYTYLYNISANPYTYTPYEISTFASGGGGSTYTNSDVDSHLNTGSAGTNEVLSWDGADYDWVAQSTGGGAPSVTATLLRTMDNPSAGGSNDDFDEFGTTIAINGNIIAASAYAEEDPETGETQAGVVYLYDATTHELLHVVLNPTWSGITTGTRNLDNDDTRFGGLGENAMDISGNYMIVGVKSADAPFNASGVAYIFDITSGKLLHVLTNNTGATVNDLMGHTTVIDDNLAAVSVSQDSDGGSVMVYEVSTGTRIRNIPNPNSQSGIAGLFGEGMSLSKGRLAIGTPTWRDGASDPQGRVYIYDPITGELLHTLENPVQSSANDRFGEWMHMDGNYLAVGVPEYLAPNDRGRVYIYNVNSGALIHTLENPTANDGDHFGMGISVSGSFVAVGAYGSDTTGNISGSVYIFDLVSGDLVETIENPNAFNTSSFDSFGSRVSLSGNRLIVNANGEDTDSSTGRASGKVYSFYLAGVPPYVPSGEQTKQLTAAATTRGYSRFDLEHAVANPNPLGDASAPGLSNFGAVVDISGDYFVAGAAPESRAYIGSAKTGKILHILNNPNINDTSVSVGGDQFGRSVAISGNYCAISAINEDPNVNNIASNAGAIYIFNVITGALVHTLVPRVIFEASDNTDLSLGGEGHGLAMDGRYLVAGSYNTSSGSSGRVFVYDVFSGTLLYTIEDPKVNGFGLTQNHFGYSVDIQGNHFIVGAYTDDLGTGFSEGVAHVYDLDSSRLLHTFSHPSSSSTGEFGVEVSVSGDYAVVSNPTSVVFQSGSIIAKGTIRIYSIKTGKLLRKIGNPLVFNPRGGYSNPTFTSSTYGGAPVFDGETGNSKKYDNPSEINFGYNLKMDGDYLIVGADEEESGRDLGGGAAYVYDVRSGDLVYKLKNPNFALSSDDTDSEVDRFGETCAISGNRIIIGATFAVVGDQSATGAVYIFKHGGMPNYSYNAQETASFTAGSSTNGHVVMGNQVIRKESFGGVTTELSKDYGPKYCASIVSELNVNLIRPDYDGYLQNEHPDSNTVGYGMNAFIAKALSFSPRTNRRYLHVVANWPSGDSGSAMNNTNTDRGIQDIKIGYDGPGGTDNTVVVHCKNHGFTSAEVVIISNPGSISNLKGVAYHAGLIDDDTFILYTNAGLTTQLNGSTFPLFSSYSGSEYCRGNDSSTWVTISRVIDLLDFVNDFEAGNYDKDDRSFTDNDGTYDAYYELQAEVQKDFHLYADLVINSMSVGGTTYTDFSLFENNPGLGDYVGAKDISIGNGSNEQHITIKSPVIFPPFTTAERDAIRDKQNGMVVFNTSTVKLQLYNAGSWTNL